MGVNSSTGVTGMQQTRAAVNSTATAVVYLFNKLELNKVMQVLPVSDTLTLTLTLPRTRTPTLTLTLTLAIALALTPTLCLSHKTNLTLTLKAGVA